MKDQRELIYMNQNIVKLSVSTNNWFNVMNNNTRSIIFSLIKMRFNFEEGEVVNNKSDFVQANKCLDELNNIINELNEIDGIDMGIVLNQTLFLPLELIVDKYKDDNFMSCLRSLVGIKMNTDNIMNIYDYSIFLASHDNGNNK